MPLYPCALVHKQHYADSPVGEESGLRRAVGEPWGDDSPAAMMDKGGGGGGNRPHNAVAVGPCSIPPPRPPDGMVGPAVGQWIGEREVVGSIPRVYRILGGANCSLGRFPSLVTGREVAPGGTNFFAFPCLRPSDTMRRWGHGPGALQTKPNQTKPNQTPPPRPHTC